MLDRMRKIITLGLAAAGLTLCLAACGTNENPPTTGNPQTSALEQSLRYARCMREHGVNMPDPAPDGAIVAESGIGPGAPAFEEANKLCSPILTGATPSAGSGK